MHPGGVRRVAAAIVVAAAVAVGSTGCSGTLDKLAQAATTPTSSKVKPTLAAGQAWHASKTLRLGFSAPTALKEVPRTKRAILVDTKGADALGAQMGMGADGARKSLEAADLYLRAPMRNGYAANLSVTKVAGVTALPDEEELTKALTTAEGVPFIDKRTTAAGPAIFASIQLKAGGRTFVGRNIFVRTPAGLVMVSVNTDSATQTKAIGDAVLASLYIP